MSNTSPKFSRLDRCIDSFAPTTSRAVNHAWHFPQLHDIAEVAGKFIKKKRNQKKKSRNVYFDGHWQWFGGGGGGGGEGDVPAGVLNGCNIDNRQKMSRWIDHGRALFWCSSFFVLITIACSLRLHLIVLPLLLPSILPLSVQLESTSGSCGALSLFLFNVQWQYFGLHFGFGRMWHFGVRLYYTGNIGALLIEVKFNWCV